jgi:energy-coupling factor transporter ATP-binding protein EcfA2
MSGIPKSEYESLYQGARWMRTDLHLHSPGAHSFRLPSGLQPDSDQDEIVTQYVEQLVAQNIQVAAITDYQKIRKKWFVPIREAAQAQGIVVFPGVELSFRYPKYGLHILAIFPHDTDPDTINDVVQALDRRPADPLVRSDGSHRHLDTEKDIRDVLSKLRQELRVLLIPAHPRDDNGLFRSSRWYDAADFVKDVEPDAIESFSKEDRQRLLDTGVLSTDKLQRIPEVEFSDPKDIMEIGTKTRLDGTPRATYLKLSDPGNLNALRLAFYDAEVLVRTGAPPETAYTHFLRLAVDGEGFLGGLTLALSPELNVLIGGRGVGKSTILETLRYVLDLAPYEPTEYRDELVRYALGSGGKATLWIEQALSPQVRRFYRFERVWGETPRVFELDPEREVPLGPLDVLGDTETPLFFGQREIYAVARNERQRLRLLDEIIGRQARAQVAQVQKLETQLRDNTRRILDRLRRLDTRDEIAQRFKEIEHEIEIYNRYGVAEKLREATSLAADEQRLAQTQEIVRDLARTWHEASADLLARLGGARKPLAEGQSSQQAILLEAVGILQNLQRRFEEAVQKGAAILEDGEQQLSETMKKWQAARQPLGESIRQVKQSLGSESLDPDRLIRLTTERSRLHPQLQALDVLQGEVAQLQEDRLNLLGQLRDARREVWKLRQKQADAISDQLRGRVKVDVDYKGQKDVFLEHLVSFFQGSGVDRRSLERLIAGQDGVDGYTIAEQARKDTEALQEKFSLTPARARQVYTYLTQDRGRLYDLELLAPEDAVRVFLKVNEKPLPLAKLSDGQKATAMLLLLLVQADRLLLVDQPEDDLDNRFIYEDIVRILREQKAERQLLAATHNPNIPVLGNAELIVALEATESKAAVTAQGAIDQEVIQGFVKSVMEGGEDAFRRRAQKYGWLRGRQDGLVGIATAD